MAGFVLDLIRIYREPKPYPDNFEMRDIYPQIREFAVYKME